MIVQAAAAPNVAPVVAVNPPTVPTVAAVPPSVISELMRPLPLPFSASRTVWPDGGAHAVTVDDLADQYDTTQLPAFESVTDGVFKDVPLPATATVADSTGFVAFVPR